MCDMPNCQDDATNYAWIRPIGLTTGGRPASEARRLELCGDHYRLALQFGADQIVKIQDHGPLNTGLKIVK